MMAKIIDSYVESHPIDDSYHVWKIAIIGAALGLAYWVLSVFISGYTSSIDIAANVATIIVATAGVVILVKMRTSRPLLIALASALSLWGLSSLTDGLIRYEAIAWSLLLYSLAYTLFSWISRYSKVILVITAIIAAVVIVRISLIL